MIRLSQQKGRQSPRHKYFTSTDVYHWLLPLTGRLAGARHTRSAWRARIRHALVQVSRSSDDSRSTPALCSVQFPRVLVRTGNENLGARLKPARHYVTLVMNIIIFHEYWCTFVI